MTRTLALVASLVLGTSLVSAIPPPEKGNGKAAQAANDYLKEKKVQGPTPVEIKDVGFPDYTFFAVNFPQFPVARVAPAPFASNNILAVDKDNKVMHITDLKGLEDLFKAKRAAKSDDDAKAVCKAWLMLVPTLHTDGIFKFSEPKDVKVESKDGARTARGGVTVTAGGKGEVTTTLTFDKEGKLTSAKDEAKLKADMRPICQATRLLDPDPVVRRMCEQGLVTMGPGIKSYLDEQRKKASPELQKEIDRVSQRIIDEGR